MKVFVKFAGPLRRAAGVKQAEIELDGESSTGQLLRRIGEQFPGVQQELFGEDAKNYYSVFINDRLVPEQSRQSAQVKEGDQVMILLPVAGG